MSSTPQPFREIVCTFAKIFRVCRALIGAYLGRLVGHRRTVPLGVGHAVLA
jgi:hypothetical protein